jgi:hypothetical protein
MLNGPANDDRSYFDIYASDTLKKQVKDYITGEVKSTTPDYNPQLWRTLSNPLNFGIENQVSLDFDNDITSTDTIYYLLVTAAHSSADTTDPSAYGFRAQNNIGKKDTEPPKLLDVSPSLTEDKDDDGNLLGTYSGTITLTFSKSVYLLDNSYSSDRSNLAVWGTGSPEKTVTAAISDGDTGIAITNLWGGSMIDKLTVRSTGENPTQTYTFDCKSIVGWPDGSPGDTLILFNSGRISNANGSAGSYMLKLTCVVTTIKSLLSGETIDDDNLEKYVTTHKADIKWEILDTVS